MSFLLVLLLQSRELINTNHFGILRIQNIIPFEPLITPRNKNDNTEIYQLRTFQMVPNFYALDLNKAITANFGTSNSIIQAVLGIKPKPYFA